nr:PREDICTED: uncharacterized protein LOC107079926 isoform X1 [Lepisosteus oculatus]
MENSFAAPQWLLKARTIIENSQEWKAFTADLFEAVQQQQTENHVSFFADLSEAEKALFLERAAKAICRGNAHKDVIAHIGSSLENILSGVVAAQMSDSGAVSTKSDLFQSHVRDGMVNLLHKWPDMKSKLHILFNHSLPSEIRKVAWRLYLSNTKARMDYLTLMSMNKVRSKADLDISQQCEALLSREPTFRSVKENTIGSKAMRNVLSYYHRMQHFKTRLPDSECVLLIPLVEASVADATPSTSVDTVTTLLVEEYITFMECRPAFMRSQSPGARDDAGSEEVFAEVAQMLDQKEQELSNAVREIHARQGDSPHQSLLRGVKAILQPILTVFFVGYLNMTTLLYIWDQYIIGIDKPSYSCVPAFSFAFIQLLKDHLQACRTEGELAEVPKSRGPALVVQQFRGVISKHFHGDLYSALTRDEAETFPILDPVQAFFPPWTHLSSKELPLRTRPKDRRLAREERAARRADQQQRAEREEQLQRLRAEEEIRSQEERLQRQLEETKRVGSEQKLFLEEQLAQERQHRYEMQKRAEEQISQLQAEIKKIREEKLVSTDIYTVRSFGTPPPSPESKTSRLDRPPSPAPQHAPPPAVPIAVSAVRQVNGRTPGSVAADLLQAVMQTANTIVNGHNMEREELDSSTQDQLHSYREAVRNAELEVCGRYLDADEVEHMTEPVKSELKKRLAAAVKRGVEARYRARVMQAKKPLPESFNHITC